MLDYTSPRSTLSFLLQIVDPISKVLSNRVAVQCWECLATAMSCTGPCCRLWTRLDAWGLLTKSSRCHRLLTKVCLEPRPLLHGRKQGTHPLCN